MRIRVILSISFVLSLASLQESPVPFIGYNSQHRPGFTTDKYITSEMEMDIEAMINDRLDYVHYANMHTPKFLAGLHMNELLQIEQVYKDDFIDNQLRYSDSIPDNTDTSYYRISKVYWLTWLDQGDKLVPYPHLRQFKKWVQLFKAAVDKHLPEPFEVADVEEQYLLYENGGKFVNHLDTRCNPLQRNCDKSDTNHIHRLITYLIYLNPDWKEGDGGTLTIFTGDLPSEEVETVKPEMGKGIIFRSDKVFHSADLAIAQKRAITLFVKIREVVEEVVPELAATEHNTNLSREEVQAVENIARRALQKGFKSMVEVATYMKYELQSLLEGEWHLIVGKELGYTASSSQYVSFQLAGLIFYAYR